MPFEILTLTPATLTSFTGRTETHGKHKVPAVSCRLRFRGPNTLLDKLSPSIRHTLYMAAEGQEDLPGVEPTTPLLRCKDIKTWSPENCYEGWTVTIEHGIDDSSAIVMGGCKVDAFTCDLFDGGTTEIECRVSSSDIDWMGAGRLWSRQQTEVKVMLAAPLTTQTNPEAGQVDERQQGWPFPGGKDSAGGETPSAARQSAEEAFAADVEKHGPGHSANPAPKKPRGGRKAVQS